MTHELATAPPKGPPPATRTEADLLGTYRSKIETIDGFTWSITEADAPRGRDLVALQARRQALAAFEPAEHLAIAARVARLFQRFPAMKNTPAEQVTVYVKDLERFPLWAIDRGFMTIIQGDTLRPGSQSVTSPDVQRAVRAAMEPVREELALLDAVLGAKVVTPAPVGLEARKVIAEAVRSGMRMNAPPTVPLRTPDARLSGRFNRPAPAPSRPGDPIPSLSAEIRAKMGLAEDLPEERT